MARPPAITRKTQAMQNGSREISTPVVTGTLRVIDIAAILATAAFSYLIRFGHLDFRPNDIWAMVITSILAANVFHSFRLYDFHSLSNFFFQFRRVLLAWSIISLMVVGIGFLTKTSADFSRIWILVWFTLAAVALCIIRFVLRVRIEGWRRQGLLLRHIAIIGAGDQGQRLVRRLIARRDDGFELVGLFDDRGTRVPETIEGVRVRGNIDTLLDLVREKRVDQIIVALPWSAEERLVQVMQRLKTVPTDVRLCPEGFAFEIPDRGVSQIAGIEMLNIFERPISNWGRVLKEAEDRILATLILLFISPLLLLIALSIRLTSRGPVLFWQKRYGFNNEIINVCKFRTMYQQPETDDPGVTQARRDDPRITPVGGFLRRSSFDELPQFINVLQGTMSIVGPRPHAVAHNERFSEMLDQYLARHNVRPGITGWAQVNGFRGEIRSEEDLENRIKCDIYYIDNWSILFDIRIILLTLLRGFFHRNAY